jgi:hypothetical protein
MELTSAQCRDQEAIQWKRAKDEPLENVRIVALKAAIAWGQEAVVAERREAHRLRVRTIAEKITQIETERAPDDHDRALSENPDRGCA